MNSECSVFFEGKKMFTFTNKLLLLKNCMLCCFTDISHF